MQFAFAYFYYLMGVKQVVTAADVFREMDTDNSLYTKIFKKNSYYLSEQDHFWIVLPVF
ncbi:hypothetical protein DPMN_021760 [Dreissena polymorpha]|uniref:Uncharacterized protein n=1 Tax=Dreissena polymorpha TaxID=45954 RepID=A0A9D4SC12_DREPO|nr:hypothetical protein DPMN_021760 [Dreissena polymorpha]